MSAVTGPLPLRGSCPDRSCPVCGSPDPRVSIGWPVCPCDWFHEDRRRGLALRRYRGAHRPAKGRWTVEELEVLIEVQERARRIEHRRSLRYPALPSVPLFLGEREVRVSFFGESVRTYDDASEISGTFEMVPGEALLTIPAIAGAPLVGDPFQTEEEQP